MTGIKRIFLYSLGFFWLLMGIANADDSSDAVARAATRRDASSTVTRTQSSDTATVTRAQTDTSTQKKDTVSGTARSANSAQQSGGTRTRSATTSVSRDGAVVRDVTDRNLSSSDSQSISARTATNVLPRTATDSQSVITNSSRSATNTRDTVLPRTLTTGSRIGAPSSYQPSVSRSATTTVTRNNIPTTARTAVTNSATSRYASSVNNSARLSRAGITAEEIINRDYTTCREVYYSCMDEFCANKDSQLKRCACSSRVNEFDNVKSQLAEVEDRLLDFNQKLLTVNLDREDAEAIMKPTEGEIAFQKDDKTDSKKLLDEISKKLNDTFDTSAFDANLSPISLSLNIDAAFDTVDSLAGASTTTLNGTSLYSAALPVCREMALEVCTSDELDMVESGYQMAIEQDCNTVAKAYETQQDLAREKIREGSALLDISRLDTYQNRNSDNILTCKKKMLDMLTNTAVCGENLGKCLDITGQYIDPSTGEAILTQNLVNLNSLITRPSGDQTWTGAPGNEKFVSYLNSKKIFLESATEHCQDVADTVWNQFMDDALAQIKLAQDAKMEEIRQSCTTLTAQCLSNASESLEDFDARALSIFGVQADKTVKQMCAEVQNACIAVLDTTEGGADWGTGVTQIATDKTYETILQTCREVGRSCIIQSCKSISGNFGLCDDIDTSVNRKAIINRTACWDEVLQCVADAGATVIQDIVQLHINEIDALNSSFYTGLYGQYSPESDLTGGSYISERCITDSTRDTNCIYDICADECGFVYGGTYTTPTSDECRVCRMAEKIWGNCEAHPTANLSGESAHNQIKIPSGATETLLSWFAKNTNTENEPDSCRDTSCGPGMIPQWDANKQITICVSETNFSDDGEYCPVETYWRVPIGGFENCCKISDGIPGNRDSFGNCCLSDTTDEVIDGLIWNTTSGYWNTSVQGTKIEKTSISANGVIPKDGGLCIPGYATFVMAIPLQGNYYGNGGIGFLFCTGGISHSEPTTNYPNGQQINCSGQFIIVTKSGEYMSPLYSEGTTQQNPKSLYYETNNSVTCTKTYNSVWSWVSDNPAQQCTIQSPTNFIVQY